MKAVVRVLAELAPDFVLAPERYVGAAGNDGVPLGDLVEERSGRIERTGGTLILDTSHVRDGTIDVAGALRDRSSGLSTKKCTRGGDLLISRLRPYLRQIALVHPGALAASADRPFAVSSEFFVLVSRGEGESLAFLVPFLLSCEAQRYLAGVQEGGHHPRVPRSSLFALRVPHALVGQRAETSKAVLDALAAFYDASSRLRTLVDP